MRRMMYLLLLTSLALPLSDANASDDLPQSATGWKAGVARVVITPQQPLWMAGYATRNHASEGTLHDLWAKALALEDARGNRAVLVTTDLLGLPKGLSDRIRDRLLATFNLSRAQLLLNSSHTHSGPVLNDALFDIYPLDSGQLRDVEQYTATLEDQLVTLVGDALKALEPVQLYAQNGVTRFQVNRRNNDDATLPRQTELHGPNDYAVPVIKVMNQAGSLLAVAFGYACHNTVLDIYEWSGDYAGFAQLELEERYPEATALFFQGAGADQNPLPRRTIPLAKQYGQELAAAVDRVLQEEMRELPARLTTAYAEVDLPLASPPTEEALLAITEEAPDYERRWASRLLEQIRQGNPLPTSYPYPLQVWQLGDQPIMSLGGELVVDYAIQLKRIFGQHLFVLGYSNDVMAYIPSARILREGGYEGATSQIVYGLPATWAPAVETVILDKMVQLAEQAGVPKPTPELLERH